MVNCDWWKKKWWDIKAIIHHKLVYFNKLGIKIMVNGTVVGESLF